MTKVASANAAVPSASWAYWTCQLVGWGLYFVVTVYELGVEDETTAARALSEPLGVACLGIALTHAFRRRADRRQWGRLAAGSLLVRMLAAASVLAVVHVGLVAAAEIMIFGDRPDDPVLLVVGAVLRWTLVFLLWLALYFGAMMTRQRRNAELTAVRLERDLRTAELRALRAQLDPHFLFNCLNSVRALISEDPERAQRAVTQLARTLRHALGPVGRDELVTLDRELQVVGDYLDLEALRLDDRLHVVREVSEDARPALIPAMLLQLLVENALKHGIARLPEGGSLRLTALLRDGGLMLEVTNPRPILPGELRGETADSLGIGFANASERLRLLCGPTATLRLDLAAPGHATARAWIPQP
ncbi:MAG: histidine kinase [Kofleriaceae bacterium]